MPTPTPKPKARRKSLVLARRKARPPQSLSAEAETARADARRKAIRSGQSGIQAQAAKRLQRVVLGGTSAVLGQTWTEQAFNSNPDSMTVDRWSRYQYRLLRYAVYWAAYEQNLYREVHTFSDALKEDRDLYSAIRTIYSPGYRIGEFWAEHIYSGLLDPEAGDGTASPTAIPIMTDDENLRTVIAEIFRVSDMQTQMTIYARFGAVCGDVGLRVVDDEERQQVFIQPVHARIVREVSRDGVGNVKGYVFVEPRDDPRVEAEDLMVVPQVLYKEVCTRVGESVEFATYLDDELYDWKEFGPGEPWTELYGFVPFVFHQHRNKGLGFGWSELHPTLGKLMELDEVASKVNDQIRKLVECAWFFAGVPDPGLDDETPVNDRADRAVRNLDRVDRDDQRAFYASDPHATAKALVADLDIAACLQNRRETLEDIERDHPELQADMATSSGDASGRALRVAREKVEARVVTVRNGYDSSLKRAVQMAISIGAQKGYPGFEAFAGDAFDSGALDFHIGSRPVFSVDTMANIEEEAARAMVLKTHLDGGLPLEIAMDLAGYTDVQIEKAVAAKEAADKKAQEQALARTTRFAARFSEDPAAVGPDGNPADPTQTPQQQTKEPKLKNLVRAADQGNPDTGD